MKMPLKPQLALIAFALMMLSAGAASAQGFTLASEYAKQVKKYPDIQPYIPDVHGVVVTLGVEYSLTADGRALRLDIFRPGDAKGLLAPLVLIHGGGWSTGSRSIDHPMAMRLAEGGVCVFCVEYRLSGEAQYPAAVVDINSALAWIGGRADSLGVDLERLTIAGTSAGGQLAALVGATNGTFGKFLASDVAVPRVRRVIDIDGVLAFIHPDSSEGIDKPGKLSSATRWLGTPMAADSALWNEASALSHIGEWSAGRFLFINSGQKRFSAGQAEAVAALKGLGKSVCERKFEGTPHTFWLFEPWAEDVAALIISEMAGML